MNMVVKSTALEAASAVRYVPGERDQRPWGSWEVLATGPEYTLKRIVVLPGHRLSLQYHHHRAEHWTIVAGEGEVEIDGVVMAVSHGRHVHIPKGAQHRIRNTGEDVLVFIEVQVGQLLCELDIVRVTDDYGRQAVAA